jgi:hypothetical protein
MERVPYFRTLFRKIRTTQGNPTMAKKPRVKKQGGGLKVLLDNNWEKLAFGLALAIGAGILSLGLTARKGIESAKTPDQLDRNISDATSYVNKFEWAKDFEPERDVAKNLRECADQTLKALAEVGYSFPQMIKPPYHPPRVRRTDPVLFAAEQLEARSGFGFMTDQSTQMSDFQPTARPLSPDGPKVEKVTGRAMPRRMTDTSGMISGGEYAPVGSNVQEKAQYFVVVTGLVPYRKQLVEYLDRFKNADGFNPSRDLPRLIMWKLQRATVAKGKVGPFKVVANRSAAMKALKMLSVSGQDFIDADAIDPFLTLPNPMIRTHNLERLARHSKILSMEDASQRMFAKQKLENLKLNPKSDDIYADASSTPGFPGAPGGLSSVGSGRDGDREGRGAPDSYRPGIGATGSGMGRYSSSTALDPNMLYDEKFDPTILPEFKMFRYYDFDVKAGMQYQYKLVLEYEDPNNPQMASYSPPDAALASEVLRRKSEIKKKNPKTGYIRATEPSAPSNIVSIVAGERLVAGDVVTTKPNKAKDTGVTFRKPGDEPKVKLMAVEYDESTANEFASEFILGRGGMPYAERKVEPIARSKAWLEKSVNHTFAVDEIVVDIRGGDDLTIAKLTSPGEALVWNTNAQRFDVVQELKDEFTYPTFVIPKDSAETEAAGQGGYGPPGGGREGGGREGGGRPR